MSENEIKEVEQGVKALFMGLVTAFESIFTVRNAKRIANYYGTLLTELQNKGFTKEEAFILVLYRRAKIEEELEALTKGVSKGVSEE